MCVSEIKPGLCCSLGCKCTNREDVTKTVNLLYVASSQRTLERACYMSTQLINRSVQLAPYYWVKGQQYVPSRGQQMLGPAAAQRQPHTLGGLRTCLLVGLVSGIWCQALCMSTHTHTRTCTERSRDIHFTHFALMAHHHYISFHIALFSLCCFIKKRTVTPPTHTFFFPYH